MSNTGKSLQRRDELLIFAGALIIRLIVAAFLGRLFTYSEDGLYDDGAYIVIAQGFIGQSRNLALTHPPGYPLFLAPFLLLGQAGIPLARLAQLVLGAGSASLSYRLALTLGLPRFSALAGGALTALIPMSIYFGMRILSETPFVFLVLVFFLVWLKAWSSGSPRMAALCGFFGAIASLTRGVILPFGGMLALIAFWRRKEQPRWLSLIAACGAVWALTVLPWTVRNWIRYEAFVPISLQGGWNFYEGMALTHEETKERPLAMAREAYALGLRHDFERDDYFAKKAKAWIKDHPLEFVELTIRKVFKFWRPFPYPPHPAAVRWATGLFTSAIFILAFIGLRSASECRGFPFILGWVLFLTAMHSIFASNLRYRLPLEPFIAVVAGAGLASLLGKRK